MRYETTPYEIQYEGEKYFLDHVHHAKLDRKNIIEFKMDEIVCPFVIYKHEEETFLFEIINGTES